jgi:hypothetical protein
MKSCIVHARQGKRGRAVEAATHEQCVRAFLLGKQRLLRSVSLALSRIEHHGKLVEDEEWSSAAHCYWVALWFECGFLICFLPLGFDIGLRTVPIFRFYEGTRVREREYLVTFIVRVSFQAFSCVGFEFLSCCTRICFFLFCFLSAFDVIWLWFGWFCDDAASPPRDQGTFELSLCGAKPYSNYNFRLIFFSSPRFIVWLKRQICPVCLLFNPLFWLHLTAQACPKIWSGEMCGSASHRAMVIIGSL